MDTLYFDMPIVFFILKSLSSVLFFCVALILLSGAATLVYYLCNRYRR